MQIGFDYEKAHEKIIKFILKCNDYDQNAGLEIVMIKKLINKINFNVMLELVQGYENKIEECRVQPLKHAIKEYDVKSKNARENALEKERDTSIKHYRICALMKNDITLTRLMQETIRVADVKETEKKCGEHKLGCEYDFVDKDTQNAFNLKNDTAFIMKCSYGHNYFELRNSMINNSMLEAHFTRC